MDRRGPAVDGVSNGGAGVVVRWSHRHQDTTLSLPTGRRTDSTASEAAALAAGLRHVQEELEGSAGARVWALFDSRALHESFQNLEICRGDRATVEAARALIQLSRRHAVHLVWIPGNAGLELNEEADRAAKAGCLLNQEGLDITAAAARAHLREAIAAQGRRLYEERVAEDHVHRVSTRGDPLPDYPGRSRRRDVLLHQLRVGRAPFLQPTRHRWGLADSPACPHCRALHVDVAEEQLPAEDTAHFLLHCPRWDGLRLRTLGPNPSLHSSLHLHPSRVLELVERAGLGPPYAERRDP